MTVPSVSRELHRAIVREHDRLASDILATNAALAERVQALEAALDAKTDEAARFRELVEVVEWVQDAYNVSALCPWCDNERVSGHAPDCPRQAALAQTAQASEVKA